MLIVWFYFSMLACAIDPDLCHNKGQRLISGQNKGHLCSNSRYSDQKGVSPDSIDSKTLRKL